MSIKRDIEVRIKIDCKVVIAINFFILKKWGLQT